MVLFGLKRRNRTVYNVIVNRLFLLFLEVAMSRKDKKGYVLHKGESQRADGRYVYTYTDRYKNRRYVYARSLAELREKERSLNRDYEDGLDPAKSKNLLVNHLCLSHHSILLFFLKL
jgi:hypothetical protein